MATGAGSNRFAMTWTRVRGVAPRIAMRRTLPSLASAAIAGAARDSSTISAGVTTLVPTCHFGAAGATVMRTWVPGRAAHIRRSQGRRSRSRRRAGERRVGNTAITSRAARRARPRRSTSTHRARRGNGTTISRPAGTWSARPAPRRKSAPSSAVNASRASRRSGSHRAGRRARSRTSGRRWRARR